MNSKRTLPTKHEYLKFLSNEHWRLSKELEAEMKKITSEFDLCCYHADENVVTLLKRGSCIEELARVAYFEMIDESWECKTSEFSDETNQKLIVTITSWDNGVGA